jgi:hypothetical protein
VIPLFCGYDEREAVGYHVFCESVIQYASVPVSFAPIRDKDAGDGSNSFTYARFRVPQLCEYRGWAIFADACDMLMLGDVAELWALRDERCAVQVVTHDYKTRHRLKYLGTEMQCPNIDYPRKNWSSLMLINCEAPEWASPAEGKEAHQFKGFASDRIGALPAKWNCLVDEGQNPEGALLLHWTAGIPAFHNYTDAPQADKWHAMHRQMREAHV